MFTAYPTYQPYRTLHLTDPLTRGEDVYALQTALKAYGSDPGTFDGILGNKTATAIWNAQQRLGITVDGLAGGGTQTALTRFLTDAARAKHNLPVGLVFGQVSHESGCRVGNYSPRRDDGTYDAGVAQRNTKYTPASEGFNVPESIEALGARTRAYYDRYAGVPGRRRWELAAAAWNAPAFANYIAREEGATGISSSDTLRPSSTARATLEAYIDSVTAFMVFP